MNFLLIIIGKSIVFLSKFLGLGSGGTWPGEIALRLKPKIFSHFSSQVKKGFIIIAGTNGKTTTAKMIQYILTRSNKNINIIHNDSGANLLNGLVSKFVQKSTILGKIDADYAIFEVDEAVLPKVITRLKNCKQKAVFVLLNLFRDQLDRYGEVDLIASKWKKALKNIPKNSTVVLNADDPQIAFLGQKTKVKVLYFGFKESKHYQKKAEHASDSTYCTNCHHKLSYVGRYFSHIGVWQCKKCENKRPKVKKLEVISPLMGFYNKYNTYASVLACCEFGISRAKIQKAIKGFSPAFGRQEEFRYKNRKIKVFLSKNPAGFNVSLKAVLEKKPRTILLVLNDQIPDGRDVSWIWDADFEMMPKNIQIIVSGERVYDLALRIKYSRKNQKPKTKNQKPKSKKDYRQNSLIVEPNLKKAINTGLDITRDNKTLFILPTYSAMLQVRKILIGRKIL